MFSTSGIRGDAQTLFTTDFSVKIGVVLATLLKNRGKTGVVALGSDPRFSSPKIKSEIIRGISLGGFEILDQGTVPSPSLCLLSQSPRVAASAMVTGSHISENLNGVKFFFEGVEFLSNEEREFTGLFDSSTSSSIPESPEIQLSFDTRAGDLYQEKLVSLASKDLPLLKIAVDCSNGTQSEIMPQVLTRLGFQVITRNCNPQGPFIALDTEVDSALFEFQRFIKTEKVDLGVAFDPDGDRAIFVDHEGNGIPGDHVGALLAASHDSPSVVTPVTTSQLIDTIGKEIYRTPVGSPSVIGKMQQTGSTFGFEGSGGCISRDVNFTRDGGITTILLLNLIASRDVSLKTLVSSLPEFHIRKTKFICPGNLNQTIIEKAKQAFTGRLDETDGLKIWTGAHNWVLFRPSGNAPEFRVFAESPDRLEASNLFDKAISLVEHILNSN